MGACLPCACLPCARGWYWDSTAHLYNHTRPGGILQRAEQAAEYQGFLRRLMDPAESLDLVDFEAGARVAGQKFYYLRNEAVLLDLALQHYALSVAQRHGFTLHITPDLARESVLDGLGFNPRGESSQIYSVANSDLCLVGTAEITLGGMLADQILEAERLPLKLAGLSHCFRTEAGSHGQESRGLYRVHQFTKVELFVFTEGDLEHSEAMHRNLLDIEEEVFQGLGLPYRVLEFLLAGWLAPTAEVCAMNVHEHVIRPAVFERIELLLTEGGFQWAKERNTVTSLPTPTLNMRKPRPRYMLHSSTPLQFHSRRLAMSLRHGGVTQALASAAE